MPRQAVVNQDVLLETAFDLTREEGIDGLTARKLAVRAGCSTQPIFRLFTNMDEVIEITYNNVCAFFEQYYDRQEKTTEVPFVNLGLAYINFAMKEKHLFKFMFMSKYRTDRGLYELLNGSSGIVAGEIAKAKATCDDPSGLFMKMWIFIHGAACMSLTGDYDLTDEDTRELLIESYQAFVAE